MFYLPQMYPPWYVTAYAVIYTLYFLGWMP